MRITWASAPLVFYVFFKMKPRKRLLVRSLGLFNHKISTKDIELTYFDLIQVKFHDLN